MNETWQALAREAGIAAEHLAIGVSALGRANYAQSVYYGQAFFALSIGLERSSKLILVVDHAIENNGAFPSHTVLRSYGHNVRELLDKVDEIAARRGLPADERLPRTAIHGAIVQILSDFASNITRYYNLDLITGDPRAATRDDPIVAWHEHVIVPILTTHVGKRRKEKVERNAKLIENLAGSFSLVRHHTEDGANLDSMYAASRQTGMTDLAKPYARLSVLQLTRFLGHVIRAVTYAANAARLESVPHLSEFFAIFNNEDDYLKGRKTWSIYRP